MLERRSRVSIHSKLTTVSSRPVGPGKTHPFNALDHAMGLHSLHVVFYYKANIFKDFDLDPSRVSLSDALSLYPPVTGRIARNGDGNWEVICNDAGVRIVRAYVGTTLDEWLRSADGIEEMDLTVWDDMPEDPINWSPFRIQLNEFEGGGVAIGLSCTHMHADPTCLTLLYKSWIDTHRTRAMAYPPVYSTSITRHIADPNTETASVAYYAAKSAARATPPSEKMATATLKFSLSVIKRCLMEITENCANATPFDFLAALFWTSVARLKAARNHYGHSSLSICTDARRVLRENGNPLPLGYYGNALHFMLLSLENFDGSDLGHVVDLIHRHVEGIDEEEIRSSIDWLESRKGEGRKYGPPFRMYGPELTCVSMEHMVGSFGPNGHDGGPLMYEAGFGEEAEPIHVSYHVRNVDGEGLIVVMPSPEGGLARAVTVTLPEKELAELCEDQAILGLEPTMLLSGSVRC